MAANLAPAFSARWICSQRFVPLGDEHQRQAANRGIEGVAF
jgi:hypothetical protein